MRSRGWMALAALLFSGCATLAPLPVTGSGAANDAVGRTSEPGATTCASRGEADVAGHCPSSGPAKAGPSITFDPTPALPTSDASARPTGMASTAPSPEATAPAMPEAAPAVRPEEGPSGEKVPDVLEPAPPIESSSNVPTPDAPDPSRAASALPDSAATVEARPPLVAETAPEIAAKQAPARPKGRPVARVGDEVITLPELTEAVKARLEESGPGEAPTRRQVIALSRSVLKSMIVRSLLIQEATARLGGPDRVEEARARIDRAWASEEWPAILRREGVAGESELRAKLARGLSSPESLREDFFARSLATEIMRLDGPPREFDAYLDGLRRRRPITSIMSPAELAVAGRRAAMSGGDDRH